MHKNERSDLVESMRGKLLGNAIQSFVRLQVVDRGFDFSFKREDFLGFNQVGTEFLSASGVGARLMELGGLFSTCQGLEFSV